MSDKEELTHEPTMAESYRSNPPEGFITKMRFDPVVKDVETIVRGPPKYIPPVDVFLNYLEWKAGKPWYKRIGLP